MAALFCLMGGQAHAETPSTVLPGMADPSIVLELAEVADSADRGAREAALDQLLQWKDGVSAGGVARFLHDSDPVLRHRALDYLGAFESPESIAYLGTCFEHGDMTMRRDALAYLGGFARGEHRSAVAQALTPFLSDGHTDLRLTAVSALGRTGDARALDDLAAFHRHHNVDLRRAAVASLGKIFDSNTVGALVSYTDDQEADIRQAAYDSLASMGGRVGFNTLMKKGLYDDDQDVRMAVIDHVAHLKLGQSVPHLQAQFAKGDLVEKRKIIEALDDLATPEALETLFEINFSGSTFDQLLVAKVVDENREKRLHEIREMHRVLRSEAGVNGEVQVVVEYHPERAGFRRR